MPFSADSVPDHVPQSKAGQWAAVWNNVYNAIMDDDGNSKEYAEGRAFAAANAILSTRSNRLRSGDFVTWRNEDGTQLRGVIRGAGQPDPGDDDPDQAKMGTGDAEPLLEIEQYKPVRDGWEPSGKTATVKEAECVKIEALYGPSRVSRKTPGIETQSESMKQHIEDSINLALEGIKASPPGEGLMQVKFLNDDHTKIGGYGLVFGNTMERDIEGDYFTKSTDLWLDIYDQQPIFFDHAVGMEVPLDPNSQEDVESPRRYKLGRIIKTRVDDVGLWVEGVIEAHNQWVEGVHELIDRGALYFSSGSVPHLIRRTDNGAVKSWPIIELSLTPSPAEPRRTRVLSLDPPSLRHGDTGTTTDTTSNWVYGQGSSVKVKSGGGAAKNEQLNKGELLMDRNKAKRRLVSLLSDNWSEELGEALADYIKASRSYKQAEEDDVVTEEEVAVAASQLEDLVSPIAEQAKSALGLDSSTVMKTLIQMALRGIAGEEEDEFATMQAPMDEDYLEEGEEEDFLEFGEEEDFLEFGEEEDFLEFGDEDYLEFDDEEEDAMMSLYGWGSRRNARFVDPYAKMVQAAVRRELKNTGLSRRRKGRNMSTVKSVNYMRRSTQPKTLTGFLKAVKERDMSKLKMWQRQSESAYKALGINPDTSGGFLVPPDQSNEIIELLRAKSVFMRAQGGPDAPAESKITILPLNRDTLIIPRQTGAATAYWTGENAQITASEQTLGQIQLIAHKLTCLVKVSNELLQDASVDVDNFIRADMARVMALEVDRVIMYGDGINSEPLGIDAYPGLTKTALNAAPTYANLVDIVSRVEQSNVEQDDSWSWLMHPRDKYEFTKIQDGAGQYIFAGNALTAMESGVPMVLLGYPWMTTTQVDKSGSPVETDVFFGRWRDVILGMRQTIEVMASDVAGDSFEYDQTWIRAILRCDVQLRHPESIQMLTDVRAVS